MRQKFQRLFFGNNFFICFSLEMLFLVNNTIEEWVLERRGAEGKQTFFQTLCFSTAPLPLFWLLFAKHRLDIGWLAPRRRFNLEIHICYSVGYIRSCRTESGLHPTSGYGTRFRDGRPWVHIPRPCKHRYARRPNPNLVLGYLYPHVFQASS